MHLVISVCTIKFCCPFRICHLPVIGSDLVCKYDDIRVANPERCAILVVDIEFSVFFKKNLQLLYMEQTRLFVVVKVG